MRSSLHPKGEGQRPGRSLTKSYLGEHNPEAIAGEYCHLFADEFLELESGLVCASLELLVTDGGSQIGFRSLGGHSIHA